MIDEKKLIDKDIENPVEKIVTSLEVSRKLKALGIIQESCFYWVRPNPRNERYELILIGDTPCGRGDEYFSPKHHTGAKYRIIDKISAFTVTELAVMMCHCTFGNDTYECFMIHPDDYANTISKSEIKQCNRNLKKWRDK